MCHSKILLSLLLIAGLMSACKTATPKAGPVAGATPLGDIKVGEQNLTDKNQAIDSAVKAQGARVAASLYVIRDYNKKNTDPISLQVISREIDVALKEIGVDPDLIALQAAQDRAALFDQGKTAEAGKAYDQAVSAAQKASEEVGKLRTENDQLRADLLTKISAKDAELVKNQAANQKIVNDLNQKIQEINNAHKKSLQQWTARLLVIAGTLGVIGTGVLVWLTFGTAGLAVVKKGLGAWAGSLVLIGSGFIVSQPWFLWVVGGAVLLIIAGIAVLLWRAKQGDTTLKKTVQSIEEQHVDNPTAAADLKTGYQAVNLDDAQKSIIDQAKKSIDNSYIVQQGKKLANLLNPSPAPVVATSPAVVSASVSPTS
jgi:hypothetical protein